MPYVLHGRLCAHICRDCTEPLHPVVVRLYRADPDGKVAEQAAARPEDTLRFLDPKEVEAKKNRLLAETETDAEGRYRLEISEDTDYDGGPVEVDVVVTRMPGQEDASREPVHLTLTTLVPRWRQREDGLVAVWDYCIPARVWCRLRDLFGAWVVCGHVFFCPEDGQRAPFPGLRVSAFDRDWLQDDALGSAITDANGRFLIHYTTADFRPGTFLNVELFGGPDLYFRVEDLGTGIVYLNEPPSRGRQSDRENVGPCFCVRLCVEGEPTQPPPPGPHPKFTHVGGIPYATGIDTAGSGLTVSDGRAFYSTIRLNGLMARTLKYNPLDPSEAAGALEYRFEIQDLDGGSGWAPVDPATQMAATKIGVIQTVQITSTGVETTETDVFAGDANAPIVGGWIRMPQMTSYVTGYFAPNGDQLRLITTTLAPTTGDANLAGFATGDSLSAHLASTGQTPPSNRHYGIRMRIRKVGDAGTGVVSGMLARIAINNHLYDALDAHPAWVSEPRSNQLGVAMVNIAQLAGVGCAGITDALDVLVTASHPTLGAVGVTMTGPGGPYAFAPPALVGDERSGTATPPSGFVVADLDACAYIVTLSVQVLLTTGDSVPSTLHDDIAFCKS